MASRSTALWLGLLAWAAAAPAAPEVWYPVQATFRLVTYVEGERHVQELPSTEVRLVPAKEEPERYRIELRDRLTPAYRPVRAQELTVSAAQVARYRQLKSLIYQTTGGIPLSRRGVPVSIPVGGLDMPALLHSDRLFIDVYPARITRPARTWLMLYAWYTGIGTHPAYGDEDFGLFVEVEDIVLREECPRALAP